MIDLRPMNPESDALFLWRLLCEREHRPDVNISHRKMPTYAEHVAFLKSDPYESWFIVDSDGWARGSIYLSRASEVGVFVAAEAQGCGIGKEAVRLLMARYPGRRLLANVNPKNLRSIKMFEGLGFTLLQQTYALDHAASGQSS